MTVTCGWCLCHDHRDNPAPSCDCAEPGCPCQTKPDQPPAAPPHRPPTKRKQRSKA